MTENEIKKEARKLWDSVKSATSTGSFDCDPVTRHFLKIAFMSLDLREQELASKYNADPTNEIQYYKHSDFWNWGIILGCFLSESGRLKVLLNDGKAGETTMSGENTGET